MAIPTYGHFRDISLDDVRREVLSQLGSNTNKDGTNYALATTTTLSGSPSVDVSDRVGRLLGHETNLDKRLNNMSGTAQTVSLVGDTTVFTPSAGTSIRLKWIGFSSPDNNPTSTVVTVKLAGTSIYAWDMSKNGGAFAHGCVREGTVNGLLVINLSVAATVHVNFDLETF